MFLEFPSQPSQFQSYLSIPQSASWHTYPSLHVHSLYFVLFIQNHTQETLCSKHLELTPHVPPLYLIIGATVLFVVRYLLFWGHSFIEILTRDSGNPRPTKPITLSDRIQLIHTCGTTNNVTHMIKSNRTKRVYVSTDNSTDKTRRLVTKTRVTHTPKRPARIIRARTHIQSNTQQTHTQNTPLRQ